MSIASAQAAAAQHASTSGNYYNIQAGPIYLRFQGDMGVELTDNATYSQINPEGDIALWPTLNIKAFWPVTKENTLALSLGIGYVEYLRESSLSHLNITSDSGLEFKIYSGDFVFDLHDRISAIDYATQDPSVSASFIRLENTAGLKVDWDLDQLIISLGYDYDTFNSISGNFTYSDNVSDLFTGRAGFLVRGQDQFGLEIGGGLTAYNQNVLDNSTHYSAGLFYDARFTPHLTANISVGYTSYQFAHNGTVTNASDFNGYYANLTLNHQLNRAFSHSLSAGRQTSEGITANLSEDYFANYQITWNFIRKVVTTFGFEYDYGNTSGGVIETYDRYGPNVGLAYKWTDKVTTSMTYNYYNKHSNVPTLSYSENVLFLDFKYDF